MLGPSLLRLLAPAFHAGFFPKETARTLFVIGQVGQFMLMFFLPILFKLMNTHALMELIVLNIAYDLGVLPRMGHPLPGPGAAREV
jgi:hypothetical protein